MLRKQILKATSSAPIPPSDAIDIAAVATVLVTSEDPGHPIDHAFDDSRGPGGSRWIAGEPGEQTVILAFDNPQAICRVALEVEEPEVARTQELQLAVSTDGGRTYRELLRQEYTFSPPGTTFQREDWAVNSNAVTHLRLFIKPDKGGKPCRATITSLVLPTFRLAQEVRPMRLPRPRFTVLRMMMAVAFVACFLRWLLWSLSTVRWLQWSS
jgi:hypothetical protein